MADEKETKSEQEPSVEGVNEPKKNQTSDAKMNDNENADTVKSNPSENGDTEKDPEAIKKKATQLLLLGKRNILIHDFQSAVGELAASCQLFKSLYGEQADEMGDPYYYYGKALFELARSESEVLGDPMQEKEDDDDEDDDDDECDEEDDEKDGECNEDNKGENNTEANNEKNESKDGNTEGPPKENENQTEENEEVNDLQLSWEYLELAKLIYSRTADNCRETAIKLSEVYLLLGENGLESENYQTAIDDMKQALALQQKVLPEEDRRIAETFYHLGVAHSLDTKVDDAIVYFKSAISQLQKKIVSLEARKKAGDKITEEEGKDAFYTMDGEIESIRSIIKDIEEKISDMNEYRNEIKAEAIKQVISGSCQPGTSSTSNGSGSAGTSSSVPVTDISHLVRKKRKNEDEEDGGIKKAKQDNGV